MSEDMRPVYPTPSTHFDPRDGAPIHPDWRGITLREHFAGQALVGLLSGPWGDDIRRCAKGVADEFGNHMGNMQAAATVAVAMADALMEELKDTGGSST